jgi:molecular chaperone HscB
MVNYFKLLQIEEKFSIDLKALDTNYFSLQKTIHTDNLSTENPSLAIDINKAYTVLKDDLLRAEYMLLLNRVDISDPANRHRIPAEDIEKILDEFEQVNNQNDIKALENKLDNKKREMQELINSLNVAFINKNICLALDLTIKLKYLANTINNIKTKLVNAYS